jgi:pyruvate dehydrogenase E2 component (dihydrolipoamide acetyltransferase)
VILKIHFKEGQTIKVGQTLITLSSKTEEVKTPAKPIAKPAKAEKKCGAVVGELEEAKDEGLVFHTAPMRGEAQTQKAIASPAVRKLAMDLKVDLSKVEGSGESGRILKKDLEKAGKTPELVPQQKIKVQRKYDLYGYVERIPLKGIRKTIADNMIKSLSETAQVTSMDDIDVSKLWRIRNREKKVLDKQGVKLTFLPFIIKAVIAAIKEHPIINSSIEGDEIIIKKYYNIGIAVETELGLMVPVIKIADSKNMMQIAKEVKDLAEKAKSRRIDLMDLQGSSFTITNYGSIGGTYGTPIINPGEAAILGLGRIFDRVISVNGKLKNIKVLPVSLTFDHKILDGAEAGRFMQKMKMFLEDPDHLLLELK